VIVPASALGMFVKEAANKEIKKQTLLLGFIGKF
jgi:hypothetical protein